MAGQWVISPTPIDNWVITHDKVPTMNNQNIISEIETQVNSLRRQAAKTRRFKILQEEFRTLLRQLYAAEGKYLTDLSEDLKLQLGRAGCCSRWQAC